MDVRHHLSGFQSLNQRFQQTVNSGGFGIVLWVLLYAVIAGILLAGSNRSVIHCYKVGFPLWQAGENIYGNIGKWDGFACYFTFSLFFYAPLNLLPQPVDELVWRAITIGTFAWGIFSLVTLINPQRRGELFSLVSLITVPISFGAAQNGQSTLLLTGLTMHAMVAISNQQWWRAAALFGLGFFAKPLILVAWLLFAAVYRPLIWRSALIGAFIFLIPFLAATPEYALEQYMNCLTMLKAAGEETRSVFRFAHFFGIFHAFGLMFPKILEQSVQLLSAVGVLGLSLLAFRKQGHIQALVTIFALSNLYLMLMSPRNEGNTYAMLAPSLGLWFAYSIDRETKSWSRETSFLAVIAFLILGNYEIGKLLAPGIPPVWLAPAATTLLVVYLAVKTLRINQAVQSRERIPTEPQLEIKQAA
ncbi:hypothetical protein V22_23050 [Calycomorphotria hydatis]|uniref:DUF2029 domain-containing protein n=2 Tax=Calycomorphotria hydatis TaxID=2528027 RepID=A0A517T9M7_9PLAN|nr:hypothetical protein V22_23050 [Calycomorphotria hydatis]